MSTVYDIGPFQLDTGVGVLVYEGAPLTLGPRAIAVLTALVENAHAHVAKDRLIEAAWPGRVVEESNLTVQISAIRRALARARDGERWIETLSRRGYRFVGPVVEHRRPSGTSERARTSNLPRPLTSFVGRRQEVSDLFRLLSERRLVTLVGVGGVGKTRLALELAHAALEGYRDGVWLVDLATVSDDDAVLGAVARSLRVREQPGMALREAISAHLQDRELLLVLDNCEQVVQACAATVEHLLAIASGIRVVATSREPLQVAGEQLYRVRPLDIPTHAATTSDVWQCDAVRLFVDRARLRRPDFEISETNTSTILGLCIRLDGLPLGIELAAARLDAMSLDTLAERVHNRLQLLADSSHAVAPRQRTLRATIEWSYALLSDDEKRLLARVAIFQGKWSLSAAETIVADGSIETDRVVQVLARLVEKSLVVAEPESSRYRMLDTIRHFAREKLMGLPELPELRARFARFYVDVAEQAEPRMFGSEQRAALASLEGEIDNVLAACASCRDIDDGQQLALRLVVATRPFWLIRGLFETGLRVTLEALNRNAELPPSAPLAGAYVTAAQIGHYMGRNAEARTQAMTGRQVAEAIGHLGWQSLALTTLAYIARDERDMTSARVHLDEALALARQSGAELRIAAVLNSVAELDRLEGRFDDAVAAYEQALAMSRRQAADEIAAAILVNLATALVMGGRPARAGSHLAEALGIVRDNGIRVVGWAALEAAAMAASTVMDWMRAARLHGAADAQMEALSLRRSLHEEEGSLRSANATRSALGKARFAAAYAAGRSMPHDDALAETVEWLKCGPPWDARI